MHNITPWWLSPNGNCQNNLEDGDVIEGLPNATFPMTMNGFTYHPQNEALLQWFEFESPSSALGGAYSYPNANTLTQLSAPQNVNCQYGPGGNEESPGSRRAGDPGLGLPTFSPRPAPAV